MGNRNNSQPKPTAVAGAAAAAPATASAPVVPPSAVVAPAAPAPGASSLPADPSPGGQGGSVSTPTPDPRALPQQGPVPAPAELAPSGAPTGQPAAQGGGAAGQAGGELELLEGLLREEHEAALRELHDQHEAAVKELQSQLDERDRAIEARRLELIDAHEVLAHTRHESNALRGKLDACELQLASCTEELDRLRALKLNAELVAAYLSAAQESHRQEQATAALSSEETTSEAAPEAPAALAPGRVRVRVRGPGKVVINNLFRGPEDGEIEISASEANDLPEAFDILARG